MHRFDRRSGSEDHGTEAPLVLRERGERVMAGAMWTHTCGKGHRNWSALVGLSCGPAAVVSRYVARSKYCRVTRMTSQ